MTIVFYYYEFIRNFHERETSTMSSSTVKNLPVKLSTKTQDGLEVWEGTVYFAELRPAKLVRKSDKSTTFATRQAVLNAARSVAKTYGFDGVAVENPKARKTTAVAE